MTNLPAKQNRGSEGRSLTWNCGFVIGMASVMIACSGSGTPDPSPATAVIPSAAPVAAPSPELKCEGKWAYYTLITGGGGMERSNLFTTRGECDGDHASTAELFRQMGLGTVSDCKCL